MIRRPNLPSFVLMPVFFVATFYAAVAVARFDDVADEERIPLRGEGTVEPYDLRVEYLEAPQGIDEPAPRFSWKLDALAPGQGQTAYRLLVKKIVNSREQQDVWDTGIVENADQAVIYAGNPLEPGTPYVWELTVWDKPGGKKIAANDPLRDPVQDVKQDGTEAEKKGKPSRTVVATFSTGLFPTQADPNPWKGKWIGLDTPPEKADALTLDGAQWIAASAAVSDFNVPVGKTLYRKTFDIGVGLGVKTAVLAFAADNSHRAFVNGIAVEGGGSFKSAPMVDIAKHLQTGKNVVLIEANNIGETPNPGGCVGVVDIRFQPAPSRPPAPGQKGLRLWTPYQPLRIVTDGTWKSLDTIPEGADVAAMSKAEYDDSGWKAARVQCKVGEGPWGAVVCGSAEPPSIPARYLTKDFEPGDPATIERATASICGLGYYELYLNGEKVGDHVLDPVLTDYDKRVPYVTYELDAKQVANFRVFDSKTALRQVPSTVQVILGSGRYYAPRASVPTKMLTYGYPKLLFQLDIVYKDGTKKSVVSDESWQLTTGGPIRENNDYDGEIFDRRLQDLREAKWQPAQVVEAPKGKLVAQMMPPMRAVEEFEPVSVTEVKPGVWVFDFGVNLVGRCRLTLRKGAPKGTTITLRHAETLQTEGSDKGMLYVDNLRGAKCRDIYIARGNSRPDGLEPETYEPAFTYHGFRYAELTGLPEGYTPTKHTLTAFAINTDLPRVSSFETSDATINQVYQNVVRGTQGNYLSIPTDCPQRDERQGWQGDRAGESKGEMFLFDNVTLYRKWMTDIEDSQRDDGNLSDVCPNYWPLYGSNVTWPSAFTIIPGSIETMYGDRRTIAKHYPAMKRWLIDHLGQFVIDGIIDKDNYGDWCVPPEEKWMIHSQDPKRRTSKPLLATAYYIHNLKLLTQYALMLDKPEDAKTFTAKAEEMTAAFNKRFYDPATGKYDNGTQTSCVLPLFFGLVPKGEEQKVFKTLVDNIENVTDRHIGTGLIGGQWLNRVLTEYDRGDLSYGFATNRTYPSWGYMIEKGATTVWELWNGDTADPAMNSGNHVMLVGDLVIWYFEHLAGIKADPDRPGFEHIIMKPFVPKGLTFVRADYESPRGLISSHWEIAKDEFSGEERFVWDIEIPCGAVATVTVPTSDVASITCEGEGVHLVEELKDGVYRVPCGEYRFTAKP